LTTKNANFESYIATAAKMLIAEGMPEAAEVLRTSTLKLEETGYDNWNGGTRTYTIYLLLEPAKYSKLGPSREVLENQIDKRLKPILEQYTSDWYKTKIAPSVELQPEWRHAEDDVSRAVRQNIFDGLRIDKVVWSGRLEEVEFLQRIFDLEVKGSTDSRFGNAAGDIWQHRVNNPDDWADDWIYEDPRFNLLKGPTEEFLKFLCEMVHPVVRPDRNEGLKLVRHFNEQLRTEGWSLVEEEKIAGRPKFVAKQLKAIVERSVFRAKSVADALNAGWMHKQIERLENAIDDDPSLAIGTAKELVESCCKSILSKRNIAFTNSATLPELTKMLTKELKLVPEGIADEAKGVESIRLILRNLSALTQYLAELRSLYGTGHGRDGNHLGLEARHARLAVGAAVAFIDFVTETHHQRTTQKQNN
jgi:AbiJ N-terminal domain 3/Abortive infection C-terminus